MGNVCILELILKKLLLLGAPSNYFPEDWELQ